MAAYDYSCSDCPVCTSSVSSYPYSESFESGLGAWTQGTGDNLNWTRDANGTPSSGTGPSGGADGSWYMYIEASGNGTGYPYKTASFISPCYDLSSATGATFDFQNHMYGNSSQMNLKVETSIDGGLSWSSPIWQQTGNQGNQWNPVSLNLDAYAGEYLTLRFFGTTGETWSGDITIDDVSMTIIDGCDTVGDPCNDGNNCTVGDVYDANCNCVGVYQDADNDGICDADDQCPGFDDNLIGTACNDNDDCTTGDVWGTDCNCAGVFQDSDNDGICDAQDPTNGDCTLNAPCNDNDACTENDVYDANCNCSGTLQDDDNDGVCNSNDQCPGFDDNLIGTACSDGDDCTVGEIWDTNCNCSGGVLLDDNNNGICDLDETCTGNLPETESFESGIGNWTQGTDDDLNWTRDSGGTPSSGTGPTTGADGSWYMYIEASGNGNGYPNKTASLVSDCFNVTDAAAATLEFSYHMWGSAATMNLDVQVSTDDGNSWSAAIWTATGDQGNQWNSATVDLSPYLNTSMRIRFYGTTGTTWQGDISIDAVNIFTSDGCDLTGQACNDNNNCTTNDMYNANCDCVGTYQDSDNDGVCDFDDNCPGFDDTLIGSACDDGDDCYVGETWDNDCNCSGGTLLDNNNNGICDLDESGTCTYVVIDSENFEGGYGIWNDGGSDCRRSINDSAYANSGSYCVRLRDNTSSSNTTTDNLNLSAYDELQIDFTYITTSMENNEDFWLQISTNGGSSYTTVADYDSGDEFVNNVREFESVTINGPFSTNTRLRFRCDASNNGDRVHIDDVDILACTVTEDSQDAETEVRTKEQNYAFEYFPNPTQGNLFIKSVGKSIEKDQVFAIYSINGSKLQEQILQESAGVYELDLSGLSSGVHFLSFIVEGEVYKARIIKVD